MNSLTVKNNHPPGVQAETSPKVVSFPTNLNRASETTLDTKPPRLGLRGTLETGSDGASEHDPYHHSFERIRRQDARMASIDRAVRALKKLSDQGNPLASQLRVGLAAFNNSYTHFKFFDSRLGLQCLQKGSLALRRIENNPALKESTELRDVASSLQNAFDSLLHYYVGQASGAGLQRTQPTTIDYLDLADISILKSARATVDYFVQGNEFSTKP